jgi:NAD(P)-dependent dehydrogenase (short-subunit alcohol dehydrogenase family)
MQYPDRGELSGRVVLVTGAARGIGRETVRLLAAAGARLVLADSGGDAQGLGLDPSVIDAMVRETLGRTARQEVLADCRDLAVEGAAEGLVERALERFGRLDAVIACAGSFSERPAARTEAALVDRAFGVSARAAFGLLRAASPNMIEQKDGAFVFVTGPSAFFGLKGHAAEAAGHAATVALARSAALELRKHNVRVNTVVPTARTRLTEHLPLYKSVAEGSLSPEHVAATLVYLASPAAADVSGETLGVAGPRTYAFRIRETPGAFGEGGDAGSVDEAGKRLREALRG